LLSDPEAATIRVFDFRHRWFWFVIRQCGKGHHGLLSTLKNDGTKTDSVPDNFALITTPSTFQFVMVTGALGFVATRVLRHFDGKCSVCRRFHTLGRSGIPSPLNFQRSIPSSTRSWTCVAGEPSGLST
jgi:hypothetical protein